MASYRDIFKVQGDEAQCCNIKNESSDYVGYIIKLKTKYYENRIVLLPVEGASDIDTIDLDVLRKVEALIIYFDSKDKKCTDGMPKYLQFSETHKIKNVLVLFGNTDNDTEDYPSGDIKAVSKGFFKCTELNRNPQQEECVVDHYGYGEILQTLYNVEWSNISIKESKSTPAACTRQAVRRSFDASIKDFENMLLKIQAFKSISTTLEREEVLDHAEQMAAQFLQLIDSDIDEDF